MDYDFNIIDKRVSCFDKDLVVLKENINILNKITNKLLSNQTILIHDFSYLTQRINISCFFLLC